MKTLINVTEPGTCHKWSYAVCDKCLAELKARRWLKVEELTIQEGECERCASAWSR